MTAAIRPAASATGGRAVVAVATVAAGVAAAWIIVRAQGMGTASGTMGMSLLSFLFVWGLMMTAMMFPSVTPFAVLYLRSLDAHRTTRTTAFLAGYALLWTASGVAAYALAVGADHVVSSGGAAPRVFAASILGATALFYLTPLKYTMLGHCRHPIGLLIRYGALRGRFRDMRAGLHHGLVCLGCCWALMTLMVVFGMMNVIAMLVIAVVVAIEKLWSDGERFARGVGAVAGVLAVLVLLFPGLAVGLTPAAMPMSM